MLPSGKRGLIRSRIAGATLAILVLAGQTLSSLPAAAAAAGGPIVIHSLKNDVSAPLRDEQAGQVGPNGKGNQGHRALRSGNLNTNGPSSAGQVQTSPGPAAMPSTNTNFEGGSNAENAVAVLPPDPNGDIGPNHYVQWVNLHYQIWNRAGVSILGPTPGNTPWAGFGGVCQTTNQGDPVVRYDRMADRWVFSQFAFALDQNSSPVPPYIQCFAVSSTPDPTGPYNRYAFQISNVNFNDYPKLAVWPDAYYMTFNYFDLTKPMATQFQGAGALAFDRAKMLNGLPATAVSFTTSNAYGGLLPSDLDGSILPSAGSPNYVAGIDTNLAPSGSTLQIWKFHVDFSTPANSTFGTPTHDPNVNLAVPTYRWFLCSGARSCLKQPGTNQGLDAIPDRLMNRLQYRRFADGHESLVANHTIGIGTTGDQAAIRWYEIRNLATVPTIYQEGTYSPSTDNRWMGSIAMDQAGDIALGYSVSSTTVYPSIRYTGRLASDPVGTLPQGEATLIAGSGSQTSTSNRWGDYSMMAVDPTDDCTFWYTQEYYAVTSDSGWQTRIGSFKFQNCPPTYVAGVAGTNQSLYSFTPGARFTFDGGILLGAPAVISVPQGASRSLPIYIVTGSDNDLYVRSDALGWQKLTDGPVYCLDNPAGVVISNTLYVACEWGDHTLWHAEAPISTSGLPTVSRNAWQSLGGVLTFGPAVAAVSGVPSYFVVGSDQHIYVRTIAAGYVKFAWRCIGHPSAATFGSTTYFACHGTDDRLYYASRAAAGWTDAQALGGVLVDGTGIAATASGPIFFAEGTDRALYHRSIATDWLRDGGGIQYGAASAAIQ